MSSALWAYRTSERLSIGAVKSFILVYGTEAVVPVEKEIESLRITVSTNLDEDTTEYARARLLELESLDERRLNAFENLEAYRSRMVKAYDL